MEDANQELNDDQVLALNQLVRRANEIAPDDASLPDELFDAYLLGSATDGEKQVVWTALAQSRTLRDRMRIAVQDLVGLQADVVEQAMVNIEITQIPDLMPHINPKRSSPGERPMKSALRNRWSRRPLFRFALPAFTVAALAILLVVGLSRKSDTPIPTSVPLTLRQSALPKEMLVSFGTRSNQANIVAGEFSHADSAALSAFRQLIALDSRDYQLHVKLTDSDTLHETVGRVLCAKVVNPTTNQSWERKVPVPNATLQPVDSLTVWVLGLPKRNLSSGAMLSDTVLVTWSSDMGNEAALVFTFWDGVSYRVIGGFAVDFRNKDAR